MGAKDSKPKNLEEQRILIHGLSKVFGAFIRGIRSSIGVENFPAVLKFMLKTCYTKNHDEFCFAVLPYIHKLIDEMERSEHLEISTEDRKLKKQCVIKVKFNYPDEFFSDYLTLKTLRSLKRGTEIRSNRTLNFPEPAERTMTKIDSKKEKIEKVLEERIKTEFEPIDKYDMSSDLNREIRDLNQTVSVPITDFQTEGCAQKVESRSTELEKVREGFSWNKIFGSKRYPEMRATWNSVFYDQESSSRDPSYDTVKTLLPNALNTSSAGEEIDDQPKPLNPENLIMESDPMETVSAHLDIENPDTPSAIEEAPSEYELDIDLKIADLEFPPIETSTFLNDMLKELSLRPPAKNTDNNEYNSVEEEMKDEYQKFIDSFPVVERSSPVTEPFIPREDSSEEQEVNDFLEDQHQSLQLPFFDNAEESLWNSLVSTKTNEILSIPEEEEEQFLNVFGKQKDGIAILLRVPHAHDLSTEDFTQESPKPVANPETMQSFEEAGSSSKELETLNTEEIMNSQTVHRTSSHCDYDDKFASLERISQEELAAKLAEQDRFYEEKLKTAQRIRKEKNEDAQEEIQAIRESQKERVRMVYHN